jgi:hypothetical protein
VYRLTEAGREELEDWMAELIAVPVKEYPQFEAALSELPALSPGRALELLRDRIAALEQAIADAHTELAGLTWLPRLFVLEAEYHVAMREAELRWVRGLVAEFENRTFPDLDGWQYVHDTHEWPPGFGTPPQGWAGHTGEAGQAGQADGPRAGPGGNHPGKEDGATN